MKFSDFLMQLENNVSSGTIKGQTVEVVANTKKYFIQDIDVKSDAVRFNITRGSYNQLHATDLVNKMKDYKNMVNDEANCELVIDGKASEPILIGSIFVSPRFVEIVV